MSTAGGHRDSPWACRPGRRAWLRLARQTHNPLLRRPTPKERLVMRMGLSLLAVLVLIICLGCIGVLRNGLAAERTQGRRRPVVVTVIRQGDSTTSGNVNLAPADVDVTYHVDGVARVATMPTLFGVAPGSKLDAWVDADGRLVSRPQTRETTIVQTLFAGLCGLALLVCLTLGGWAAFNAWSMQLRAEEWEAEWLLFDTGPAR